VASGLQTGSFTLQQSVGSIDSLRLVTLLKGEAPAYIVTRMIPLDQCEKIWENFQFLTGTSRRDGVPGIHVGAFHYGKTTAEYLKDVAATRREALQLIAGTDDPIAVLHQSMASALSSHGLTYRSASSFGQNAGRFVARSWTDRGEYALAPHEDLAQLQHPAQRDFEIQAVAKQTVVGVNLCIRSSNVGGDLFVWNVKPDNQDRASLGIEHTGYPYPRRFVENKDFIRVSPSQGDLYFVNGCLLHAVEQQQSGSARMTLSFICGLINDTTVVYWT
jgi:hypothetical protein